MECAQIGNTRGNHAIAWPDRWSGAWGSNPAPGLHRPRCYQLHQLLLTFVVMYTEGAHLLFTSFTLFEVVATTRTIAPSADRAVELHFILPAKQSSSYLELTNQSSPVCPRNVDYSAIFGRIAVHIPRHWAQNVSARGCGTSTSESSCFAKTFNISKSSIFRLNGF